MNFDKILYRNFGPFIDLRCTKDGVEVATLRLLGNMPDEPTIIAKLFQIFEAPPLVVCGANVNEFVPLKEEAECPEIPA